MRLFKFFWTTHKWTGIVLATVFLLVSVTGFLLQGGRVRNLRFERSTGR